MRIMDQNQNGTLIDGAIFDARRKVTEAAASCASLAASLVGSDRSMRREEATILMEIAAALLTQGVAFARVPTYHVEINAAQERGPSCPPEPPPTH